MIRRTLLMTLALGLLLAAHATSKGDPAPREEEKEYAKVEVKGTCDGLILPNEPGPRLVVGGVEYHLDLSSQKEFQGKEGASKLSGKTLIVTGTLRRSLWGSLQVKVSSVRVTSDK